MDNGLNKKDFVQQMQLAWKNEKFSKELLKYNNDLLENILIEIERTVK